MNPRGIAVAALIAGLLVARGGRALAGEDAIPAVVEAHVEASLVEAGKNRPAIEAYLAHYAKSGDAKRIAASRWLVANMAGKGFVPFTLRDEKKQAIPFDALSFKDFAAAQKAFDAIEKERGKVDFVAEEKVLDLATLSTDYLTAQTDGAFAAWEASPPSRRLTFQAFLDWVLPYRSSEEPATAWREIVAARYRERPKDVPEGADANAVYEWLKADVAKRVRFDERYYLHPTDQSITDMESSRCGRCEDITNMTVYAARALGLAVCTDYTPYWPHRDNNHAWPVLLDRDGKGKSGEGNGAAKVYRRTFAIQRDSLPFVLRKDEESPNRYLANPCQVDVTDQYGTTVAFESRVSEEAKSASAAYLFVFNGGDWQAIAWAPIAKGQKEAFVAFLKVQPHALFLVGAYRNGPEPFMGPIAPDMDVIPLLPVTGKPAALEISRPRPDADLAAGQTYVLQQWGEKSWLSKGEGVAGPQPLRFSDLTTRTVYRLVRKTDSDKLERPFTIEDGKPRWW